MKSNLYSSPSSLFKGMDVIGLKVMTLQKGQIIDNVQELVYDPKDNHVKALVVDSGGWFADAKVILFGDIKSIGEDAVVIESDSLIRKASDVSDRVSRIAKSENYLTQNKVITENGTELGQVSDIYFDNTGKVMELEVSQGAVKNIQSGKKIVKVADVVKVGEDATIVKDFVETKFDEQSQNQGLKGAYTSAKQNAPGVIDTAKDKISDLSGEASSKAQGLSYQAQQKYSEIKNDPATTDTLQSIKQKAADIKDAVSDKIQSGKQQIDESRKKAALGKYVKVNILTPQDELLASRGDIVSSELLTKAEFAGILNNVLNNLSDSPIDPQNT